MCIAKIGVWRDARLCPHDVTATIYMHVTWMFVEFALKKAKLLRNS